MLRQNGECCKPVLRCIESNGAEVDEELLIYTFITKTAIYTISRFQRFYNFDAFIFFNLISLQAGKPDEGQHQ